MKVNRRLDIRDDTCPLTFVRTKLALESMAPGEILEVLGQGDEPMRNVPAAVLDHGHEVIELDKQEAEVFRLLLRVKSNHN